MMRRWRVLMILLGGCAFLASHLPAQESTPAQKLPVLPGSIHLKYQVFASATPPSTEEKKALAAKARAMPPAAPNEPVYEGERHSLPASYQPSADYWTDGNKGYCWTLDSLDKRSAAANADAWIAVTEDQRGVNIWYAPRKKGTEPNPLANRAEAAQESITPLGFAQTTPRSANSAMTFDSAGRLARIQQGKQKNGSYAREYEYSDYVEVAPGCAIPGVVVQENRADDKEQNTPRRIVYVLRSWDTAPVSAERFTRQHPPAGTLITDYRYPLGKNAPLRYRYVAGSAVDTQSPKQYAAKKLALRPVPSTIGTPKRLVNGAGIALVRLPGGSFRMGQSEIADPVHTVRVSPFWIGQYEVTNAQFERFQKRPRPVESLGDNQPVTRVSYRDAVAYCRWLSKKTGGRYRLPTEAEWEYAARGGLSGKQYPWGDVETSEGLAALGQETTRKVGSFYPNGFGLYDMSGNVAEWVGDWYDEAYYKRSPATNPKGPTKPTSAYGRVRTLRGGHFEMQQGECALRIMVPETAGQTASFARFKDRTQSDGTGFRVVKEER